ncbi:protein SCAI isoform X1 [Schistocerca americana]|uniref:protein SCAI isoform X1 n=1 Tax=Schistocerca americana TaxID=7009 RepID=UPI001F50284D|nr:protein SCAI isoform X1 [Schistocerca americana]XP_047098935.1 protein SCAI isoform X1 [Schistocerca piceifrons]XP_049786253.1 protein SCAI isoform X1 [Schistocerca cancellata]XP_049808593.1 protein SCAI isoform X1 [Schistocerca nitens]XP_049964474.1 protein SCAI isoform X2 [Schistocerca serialis cubense]
MSSAVSNREREMVVMAGLDDHEKKIVIEFCHLLEKSKQLFNGLRDLPQYGHKQWQAYFGRTFDIYTKLWKFQQQHRQILDTKYGLKRWQIGEIASKIGQLYYHYYLRTSETNYLNEAYSFYAAIRGRAYYSRASKEDSDVLCCRSDLMVKKLRYYARFIVVCLLLKKMKLVRDLVMELDKQIIDYTSTYEPDDQLEWSLVLEEIKSFIKADGVVSVLHADSNTIVLSHRLSPLTTPPVEKSPIMNLTLQEILIIGNCNDQVKFSELTMDMFRMVQTLEREPQDEYNHIYDASPAPVRASIEKNYGIGGSKGPYQLVCQENGDRPMKRENPHKYLLYKPTFSQIMVFLSSGFKELPPNGALLLYISADGCFSSVKHPEDMGYDLGGVMTNSKKEVDHPNKKAIQLKDMHCLYPGDLYPFTRKPLFVIVDSDNSFVFQHIPRYFGQPLVVLMSPQDLPPAFQDHQHNGSLFTLFLHSPLTAFCFICNILNIPIHLWERCQSYIDRFVTEASRLFTRCRIDSAYLQFFGDDFLRLLLLRYIFCDVVLHLHRSFKGRQLRPRSQPPLPDGDLLDHPALHHLVLDLASHLEVRSHFVESDEVD